VKFSIIIIAACLSLAACNHDDSTTQAAPPPAADPQGLPSTDASGQVISGTTVWSGAGRRSCVEADHQLVRNVRHDLKAIEADTQVGWAQGQGGRNHHDVSYLILATNRAERGIQECNRTKAEIQFSSCQMAEVNRAFEGLTR